MKTSLKIIKWSALFLLSTNLLTAQATIEERNQQAKQVELFYQMAEKAYNSGDIAAANEAIRSALDINRQHGRSIALYRRIQSGGGDRSVLALRERTFNKVVVPLIDIEDMPLRDALRLLSGIVEKETNDKVIPNFVVQDKNRVLDDTSISLTLRNVPAGDVLSHFLSDTNSTANFGKYSTVIRPRSSGTAKKSAVKKEESSGVLDE